MLIFSLPVIFGMSMSLKSINGITEKQQYKCMLKIATGLPWEGFSNFNLFRGRFSLLPFLPLSMSLCAPRLK